MNTETATPPEPRAFVLRMTPEGDDWISQGLEADQISIGWGLAVELMETSLDYRSFRDVVKRLYHADEEGYRKSGAVAGMLWRFLREMAPGDYVVVPHGQEFLVTTVDGDAQYLPDKVEEHTAFRRPVRWLADGQPIPRRVARARLQSRTKSLKTCVDASDLVDEIVDALASTDAKRPVTFGTDLRSRLIDEAKSTTRFRTLLAGATEPSEISERWEPGPSLR